MSDLAEFRASLDGELFTPGSPGYEAVRRPVDLAYQEVRPRLVVNRTRGTRPNGPSGSGRSSSPERCPAVPPPRS